MIIIVNAVTLIGADITAPFCKVSTGACIARSICHFLYFLIHTMLVPALLFYVCCVSGVAARFTKTRVAVYIAPLLITKFFVRSNPVTGWVFYYDTNHAFCRNWAEGLIYAAAVFYVAVSIVCLFYFWSALTKRRSITLAYTYLVVITGIVIQMVDINIKSELFCEALGMLCVMLVIENEDGRLDADTQTYNRKALYMDLNSFIMTKSHFHVIVVNIVNSDIIQRVTGSANLDVLTRKVAEYFQTLVPAYQIYHPNTSTFMLLCMERDGEA